MMKKLFTLAAILLALAACGGKDNPEEGGKTNPSTKADITGIWELSSVATKVSVGSVNVNVYVEFASGGNFTLYQKIGDGRYTKFTGTYTLSSDGKLSGTYSDNSAWGPYDAVIGEGTLTLTSAGGKETDTYKKISSIPSSVTDNLY